VLGAIALVVTTTAFAAVVNYLSNTIETQFTVDSPVYLDDTHFQFDINYGGEYDYALVKGMNRADVPIEGKVKLTVEKLQDDEWVPAIGGYYVAATTDIEYYFESEIVTPVTWEEWLETHWDWLDWYVCEEDLTTHPMTEEIQAEYSPMYDDVPVGTECYTLTPWYSNTEMFDPDLTDNHNDPDIEPILTKDGNSILSPSIVIEPGAFYVLIKFCTLPNIEPGTYRVTLTVVP